MNDLEAFNESLDPQLLTHIIPAHEQDAIVWAAHAAHQGEDASAMFWRGAGGYRNCHDGPVPYHNIVKGSE